jgi:succinyl-diaminopimelate desuccinylase
MREIQGLTFRNTPLTAEEKTRIIAIPSVGGLPEEGAPYGRIPREVLRAFLDEAKAKGFRTGVEGERIGWVEFGEGDRLFGILCHLDVVDHTHGSSPP